MQNAKDIGPLAYVDQLLFGPTVVFEKRSAYGVEETLERLDAARLSIWQQYFGFSTGLIGSVSSDRIRLGWRNPLTGHGLQPFFQGSIRLENGGVTVVGLIGVPLYVKAFLILPPLFIIGSILLHFTLSSPEGLGMPLPYFWLIVSALLIAGSLLTFLSRILKAGDYEKIANAIDTALS